VLRAFFGVVSFCFICSLCCLFLADVLFFAFDLGCCEVFGSVVVVFLCYLFERDLVVMLLLREE